VIGMAYTALVSNIEHYNIFFTGVLTRCSCSAACSSRFSDCRLGAGGGLVPALSHLAAATAT